MRRLLPIALLALGVVSGCGSQTKTVTVAGAPTESATTSPPAGTTAAKAPAGTGSTATTAPGSTTTRSAPEPSFTESEQPARAGTLAAAVATVRSRGYTPVDTSEYHSGQTLRVLVGTRTGSADGYGQQAFFFLGGRYLGTDAKDASAKVAVVSQGDTEVALAYPLYHSSDPLCCPSGGRRVVHFVLDNGRLTPLEAIPPASSNSGLSRN